MVVLLTKRDIRKTVGVLKRMKKEGVPINLTNFKELYRFLIYAKKSGKHNLLDVLKENFNNFSEETVKDCEAAEKEIAYICYYLGM